MTDVFVAGSRAISRLNSQVRERLDSIMKQNLGVLVGDANGADKAVQRYLAKCGYREVRVYCMEACRNNVGGWATRRHQADSSARHDRHYYGIKDAAMIKDASCGFMLWDGSSMGTLTNVVKLLSHQKKVLIYLSPKKRFYKLHTFPDLHNALRESGIEDVPGFLKLVRVEKSGPESLPLPNLG